MKSNHRSTVTHALYCIMLGGAIYQVAQGIDYLFSMTLLICWLLLQIFSELNSMNQRLDESKDKNETERGTEDGTI